MREKSKIITSLSLIFPAYNDAKTITKIVKKARSSIAQYGYEYEIIVVNDGSTDTTAEELAALKRTIKHIHIITHKKNKGYGAALWSGFAKARKDFIFYTDSDGQYDVGELPKLVAAFDAKTDMVTGWKRARSDTLLRKVIGGMYNQIVHMLFPIPIRDLDCDFRLFRRSLLSQIQKQATSGAFDLYFIVSLAKQGFVFKEVPVHHYPRVYGQSQIFTPKRLLKSLVDVIVAYWKL